MSWKKFIVGSAIGGGILGIGTYISRVWRTSVQLETIAKVNIHKIDADGLVIRIDVQLKNPTKTKFKIKFPFVKLIYPAGSGTAVGSSQVQNRDITIPSYGEAVAEKIMITIPPRNIFSVSAELIGKLLSGAEVDIDTQTITTVDIGWKKLPYQKMERVVLSHKKNKA